MILAFAFVLVLAGLFTAYFGNGKSRTAGIIMLLTGVVIGVLWVFLCHGFGSDPIIEGVSIWNVFVDAIINILAAFIGAVVAVAIFLVAVLKS